ncbi:hypothetical protein CIC12_14150 [Burkholderia sp. SG-MS1]|nr:hypothetical protein [Paraburkholderia sp. SG-MS1]
MVENAVQAQTVAARGERGAFAKRVAGEKGVLAGAPRGRSRPVRAPDTAHGPGSVPGFAA